ncbi:MAG TPA: trans-aconitate 2-methyltransferase [Caulobacteraceae bacterium]|jgi:trans-aconitate 2-methyltransferase|nr:trans-aconitate 2-methyltransferase [Caulobacteraceae bacterium]
MSDWSPATYLKFEDERTRPAADLLARVSLDKAHHVVDVGCGPGNSTELLAARYPAADILGLDNSPAMLVEARKRLPGQRFEAADAAVWLPPPSADLVFANATYQWIPDHFTQLPRVLAALRPGAVLAVQMPDNVETTTHRLMREVAQDGPWAERLRGASRAPLAPPRAYYEALQPHAERLDIWHTIYNHVLPSAAAIVEFVRSTGLRPFVDPLDDAQRADFLAAYTARIAEAYPEMGDGKVLLGFARLFIIAQR